MKAINLTFGTILALLITACSSSQLTGPGVYYDDIYYVPGASRESAHEAFSPVPSLTRDEQKAENKQITAQQREYQRSERAREQQDTRDFSGIQEEYATILNDDQIEEVDTLLYHDDETGYWVDGFQGSSMDRSYAERIVRFHGPAVRIPYHSPFYSEVVYYNHYDWNVYVDGHYAYAVPTWTNRWYNNFYYSGIHRPHHYSYGYYPYSRWSFGFHSYHYPYYSAWHSPYWHRPYYSPYYHRPYYSHHGGYYNQPSAPRTVYRGMRGGIGSDGRVASSTSRTTQEGLKQASSRESNIDSGRETRVSRTPESERETMVAQSGRVARESSRNGNEELKSSSRDVRGTSRSQDTPTRQSYTPTYSQPEGNTRPTYNRATYTRVSGTTRQTQTTGTVQNANSNTRQVQSRPATQSRNVSPTRGTTQSSTNNRQATSTRRSTPATYQQGSSTSSPRRNQSSYSTPTRRSSSTTTRSSTPSRSVSPTRSSSSSSSSVGTSSSSSSSRSSGSSSSSSGRSSRGGRR